MDSIALLDASAQSVAYTGTAGVTATFAQSSAAALVWTTSDAYVKVGVGVTATVADLPMPAYTPMILIPRGGVDAAWRVSAIQISAGGTVYAKPITVED